MRHAGVMPTPTVQNRRHGVPDTDCTDSTVRHGRSIIPWVVWVGKRLKHTNVNERHSHSKSYKCTYPRNFHHRIHVQMHRFYNRTMPVLTCDVYACTGLVAAERSAVKAPTVLPLQRSLQLRQLSTHPRTPHLVKSRLEKHLVTAMAASVQQQ